MFLKHIVSDLSHYSKSFVISLISLKDINYEIAEVHEKSIIIWKLIETEKR